MPAKITRDQFILNARAIHGDKYDYSKMVYCGTSNRVLITCPIHGDFELTAAEHTRKGVGGGGCQMCGIQKATSSRYKKEFTTASFISRAKQLHGDRYTYEKAVYTKIHQRLTITCPIHGDFEQIAQNHLNMCGCPICRYPRQK